VIDALDLSSTRPADRPLPRVSSLRMLPSEPRHALPQGPPTQRCTPVSYTHLDVYKRQAVVGYAVDFQGRQFAPFGQLRERSKGFGGHH